VNFFRAASAFSRSAGERFSRLISNMELLYSHERIMAPTIVIPVIQLRPDQCERLLEIGCKLTRKVPGSKDEHPHYEVKLPRDSYALGTEGTRAAVVVRRIQPGGWCDMPHKLTWKQATAQHPARMLSLTLCD